MSTTDDHQPTTDQDAGPPGDGMTGTPSHGPHPDPPPGEAGKTDE